MNFEVKITEVKLDCDEGSGNLYELNAPFKVVFPLNKDYNLQDLYDSISNVISDCTEYCIDYF